MNKLLNFSIIESLTQGQWLTTAGTPEQALIGGAFDTRNVAGAQIFFAWQGGNSDGHLHVHQLEGSEIQLLVVEKPVTPIPGIAILQVEDSLLALQQMAKWLAGHFGGKLISITGSSGKTTAKAWLSHLLSKRFNLLSNVGSFNNHIGCPITILNLRPEHELLILEMGTSGLGELELLSSIAPADFSILLNVGHAHLGKFGSRDNIYHAKMEIFSHLREGGTALLPQSDQRLREMIGDTACQYFGKGASLFWGESLQIDPITKKQKLALGTPWGKKEVWVQQLGTYVGEVLSGLIAICCSLGLSWQELASRLEELPQEKGRSIFQKGWNEALIFDDSYNANPESVINMLQVICSLEAERYIGIVGNLAEMDTGLSTSAQVILDQLPQKLTHLFLGGETGEILQPLIRERFPQISLYMIREMREAIDIVKNLATPQTVIGVKGSRTSHMERFIYELKGEKTKCPLLRCGKLVMCHQCDEL